MASPRKKNDDSLLSVHYNNNAKRISSASVKKPLLATIYARVNEEHYGKIKSFRSKAPSPSISLRASGSVTSKRSTQSRRLRLSRIIRHASSTQYEQSTKHARYIKSTDWDQEKWVVRDKVFTDHADWSRHPSFTIKNIAYNLECDVRYSKNTEKYNEQFQREMENFIASKRRGCDQYFTRRILSYTTYWPPLHTGPELEIFTRRFFQLTPTQKKRLNFLMNTELSFI